MQTSPKSIVRNSFYNLAYKGINILFPMICTIYVTRILLAQGIGKIASAQNIAEYFTLLAALGLPTYGTKTVACVKKNKNQLSTTFTELFTINFISTSVCIVGYVLVLFCVPPFRAQLPIYGAAGLVLAFQYLNTEWLFQGLEEYRYIMLRNFIFKTAFLIFIFLFVRDQDDLVAYLLIYGFSVGASHLVNLAYARRFVRFTTRNGLSLRKHLSPILSLLAATIAIELYTLMDITFLTFIHGDSAVGYYTTGYKVIRVVRTLIVAVCAVFLPRISFYMKEKMHQAYHKLIAVGIKILLTLTIPAAIGIFLVADDMIPILFGPAFEASVPIARITSLSVVSVTLSNFLGYQVLAAFDQEKKILYSTLLGAAVNFVLNFLLVFEFGAVGVAIASVLSECGVAAIQIFWVRKYVRFCWNGKDVFCLVLSTLFMSISVLIVKFALPFSVLRLGAECLAGMLIFIGVNFLLKNELFMDAWQRIKHKKSKTK